MPLVPVCTHVRAHAPLQAPHAFLVEPPHLLSGPPACSDVGGCDEQIKRLIEVVELPLLDPDRWAMPGSTGTATGRAGLVPPCHAPAPGTTFPASAAASPPRSAHWLSVWRCWSLGPAGSSDWAWSPRGGRCCVAHQEQARLGQRRCWHSGLGLPCMHPARTALYAHTTARARRAGGETTLACTKLAVIFGAAAPVLLPGPVRWSQVLPAPLCPPPGPQARRWLPARWPTAAMPPSSE